ncbi:MAG: 30S ribosome-binding factor RbfA [Candidatus Eisenbacteria bacterium]|uniref:Ribosome-binding factor A n=1 Tax=Eiseniibacteriota bacterium TaxID=2212470 RepID=A0A538U3N4_UNCEI|nr:MAG: 30S ribosome-binding factor RbfA [Candidatus Eisenbacteria bacterium]
MRIRPERVAETIKREMAGILADKLRDPRLSGMISVTEVEVTPDLSTARIFVSMLAPEEARQKALQALTHSAGFIRHELAPRLGLREMPELRFLLDTSIERGARVEELLRRLANGEPIADGDEEQ